MNEGINVLSFFDGMSCGQIALERAGIPVKNYYACEIDKYAIQITQKNYPNTKQLGSVVDVLAKAKNLSKIDLFIGGSPCQGFSFAGKQLNFDDPRSVLFFEFAKTLQAIRRENPDVEFLLENVKMKKEFQDIISEHLGVEPIEINSALVSAQNRKRLYWTNIVGVELPENKGIFLQDIFDYHNQSEWEKKFSFEPSESYVKIDRKGNVKNNQLKSSCLTGGHRGDGNHSDMDLILFPDGKVRRYSPIECERLQTLCDNYTEGVSNTQRYAMLGNGWTVDVIAHILKNSRYAK